MASNRTGGYPKSLPDVRGSVVDGLKPWYRADVFSGLKTEYEIRQQITDGVPDVVSATYEVIAHCRTRKRADEICHAHNMASPPAGAEREAVIEECVRVCIELAESGDVGTLTALKCADDIRALKSKPPPTVPAQDGAELKVQHWPFVESPGEFTDRLLEALRALGTFTAAVRNVLIEEPPTISAEYLRRSRPSPAQKDAELSEEELVQALHKDFAPRSAPKDFRDAVIDECLATMAQTDTLGRAETDVRSMKSKQ